MPPAVIEELPLIVMDSTSYPNEDIWIVSNAESYSRKIRM
jgi:hypothetical protein